MNKKAAVSLDDYTLFRLLCQLQSGAAGSQRELARQLDSALGLVNNYLKIAIAQGWVRVKELSVNRCSYHLTTKGEVERRNLALKHARYLDQIIPVVQAEYRQLCQLLHSEGVERVALCGIDGSSGIAWLALQESGIDVTQLMDTSSIGTHFMGREVVSLAHAMLSGVRQIVVGSYNRAGTLYQALLQLGVEPAAIKVPSLFLEN